MKYKKDKKFRKRRFIVLISAIVFISTLSFFTRFLYIKYKCRDLNFAVNYYMTNGNEDERLMRVRSSSIIFLDNDSAIVQARGLRKNSPHKSMGIEGHFKKDSHNCWKLNSTFEIQLSN